MGNQASQDEEFSEGMLEISDRGLGTFRFVEKRDIFKKPTLTSSESSTTTTEDLAESCLCKCHDRREQNISQNVVGNCCRCNRPKITEPADSCSCQCHIAVQKRLQKCCACGTRINTINSSDDNKSERATSEKSAVSSSSGSRSNYQRIADWFSGKSPNNTEENPSEQLPPEESQTSPVCDKEPEQALPEESPSENRSGFQTLTGWIFQSAPEESHSNPSAGNLPMEADEKTSSCSSFDDLSNLYKAESEEAARSPPTASWWDFHKISNWMQQTETVNTQSSSDDNPLHQAPSAGTSN